MQTISLKDLISLLEKERDEKNRYFLEELPKNFVKLVSDEIKKNKKLLEKASKDSEEAKNMNKLLKKYRETVQELLEVRFRKIIEISIIESRTNNKMIDNEKLLEEEKIIYEILSNLLRNYYNFIINNILEGNKPDIEGFLKELKIENKEKVKKEKETIIIYVEEDIKNKIVGPNKRIYGPFKKNDIYIVRKDVGEKLIKLPQIKKIDL